MLSNCREVAYNLGSRVLDVLGKRHAQAAAAIDSMGLSLKGPDGLGYYYGVVDGFQVNVMPPSGGMLGAPCDPAEYIVYVAGDEAGRTSDVSKIRPMVEEVVDILRDGCIYG